MSTVKLRWVYIYSQRQANVMIVPYELATGQIESWNRPPRKNDRNIALIGPMKSARKPANTWQWSLVYRRIHLMRRPHSSCPRQKVGRDERQCRRDRRRFQVWALEGRIACEEVVRCKIPEDADEDGAHHPEESM